MFDFELDYPGYNNDLDRADKRFNDTTGLLDGKGNRIKKPRISKGKKTNLKISVNSGLCQIAEILASAKGTSRNKVMATLVSRCLYEALRDLRMEKQLKENMKRLSRSVTLNDEIPF